MTVSFQYYNESEDASETFRFASEEKAMNKFCELAELIREQFDNCPDAEVIDEPDFFGIIDHESGYSRTWNEERGTREEGRGKREGGNAQCIINPSNVRPLDRSTAQFPIPDLLSPRRRRRAAPKKISN